MAAKKNKQQLTTAIIYDPQLTRHKQYKFKCAGDIKRNKDFKFVWSVMGDIYIGKDENTLAIKMQSIEHHFLNILSHLHL